MNRLLPSNVQYAFFSATFRKRIIDFIKKKRPDIVSIRIKRNQQRVSTVDHWFTRVENKNEAYRVIFDLVSTVSKGQTYVFARSKKIVSEITQYLNEKNISCEGFSSDLSNEERDRTLQKFHDEEFKVLITSDVLSRGIDIPNTYLVINYQTPIQFIPVHQNYSFFVYQSSNNQKEKRAFPDCDTYYHRAGRAGRFGRSGICFTIVTDESDQNALESFCSSSNLDITLNKIDKNDLKSLPEEKVVNVEGDEQNNDDNVPTEDIKNEKKGKNDLGKVYFDHKAVTFSVLLLKNEILHALADNGIIYPSEIQLKCTPYALLGNDIICQGQSGIGKTTIFIITVLQYINPIEGEISCLVLARNKEAAKHICEEFNCLSIYLKNINTVMLFEGQSKQQQIELLRDKKPNILVASPSCCYDFIRGKHPILDFSNVRFFIIDEVDQVFEPCNELMSQIIEIYYHLPQNKQTMLFAATMTEDLKEICRRFTFDECEMYFDDKIFKY